MADAVFRVRADVTSVQKAKQVTDKVMSDIENSAKRTNAAIARNSQVAQAAIGKTAKASGVAGGGVMMAGIGGFISGALSIGALTSVMRSSLAESQSFARANARLNLAGARAGLSAKDQRRLSSFVEDTETRTGVEDDRTATMLGKVLSAGEKDISNAMKKVKLAIDVEAMGFSDAESVLDAMTKAGAESEMQMRRLANKMGILTADGDAYNTVLRKMTDATSGNAEKIHEAGGGIAALGVMAKNLRQAIGENFSATYGGAINKTMNASLTEPMKKDELESAYRDILTRQFRGSISDEEAGRRRKMLTRFIDPAQSDMQGLQALSGQLRRGDWGQADAQGAPTLAADATVGTAKAKPAPSDKFRVAANESGGVVRRIDVSVHSAGNTPSPTTVRAF